MEALNEWINGWGSLQAFMGLLFVIWQDKAEARRQVRETHTGVRDLVKVVSESNENQEEMLRAITDLIKDVAVVGAKVSGIRK